MSRGQSKRIDGGSDKVSLFDWSRDKAAQDFFARYAGGLPGLGPRSILSPRDVMLDASEAIAPDVITIQWSYDFIIAATNQIANQIAEVTTIDTDMSDLRLTAEWNTGTEKENAQFDATRGGHITVCAWHAALYISYPNPAGPGPYPAGSRPPISFHTSVSLRTKADHGMPKFTQRMGTIAVGVESGPVEIPKHASRVIIANNQPAVPAMNIRQYRNQFAANPNTSAVLAGKTVTGAVDIIEGALFMTVENPAPGVDADTRLIFLLDL
jgi:hypothetical protein